MTHDPLCPHDYVPYKQLGPNSCHCDLIAKVRADERERCVTAVTCWTDPVYDPVYEAGQRALVFVDEAVYQMRNPSEGHPDWCLCREQP